MWDGEPVEPSKWGVTLHLTVLGARVRSLSRIQHGRQGARARAAAPGASTNEDRALLLPPFSSLERLTPPVRCTVLVRALQAARNEVKRYASFALRAQQELACERRQRAEARRVDAADDSVDLEGGSLCDYSHDDSDSSGDERPGDRSSERVERALDAHDVWARKITRLTKSGRPHARKDSKPAGASNQLGDGSDLSDSDAQPEAVPVRERGPRLGLGDNGLSLHDLKAFLRDQRLCIADLARENARLRDMLRSRPTRQELLVRTAMLSVISERISHGLTRLQGCRLEIERLQAQVHRLRTLDGDKVAADASRDQRIKLFLPVEERAASASRSALSDRIMDDKLLRLLHVQVESIAYQSGGSSQQRGRAAADASLLRRSFLQENVFCRLSLDPSALSSVASTENSCGAAEQHDDILRRIGRVSSEIVASCCYVLDVEDVAKLPQHVEALQRLAQIAPVYQAFTEKLEQQLQRFDLVPY